MDPIILQRRPKARHPVRLGQEVRRPRRRRACRITSDARSVAGCSPSSALSLGAPFGFGARASSQGCAQPAPRRNPAAQAPGPAARARSRRPSGRWLSVRQLRRGLHPIRPAVTPASRRLAGQDPRGRRTWSSRAGACVRCGRPRVQERRPLAQLAGRHPRAPGSSTPRSSGSPPSTGNAASVHLHSRSVRRQSSPRRRCPARSPANASLIPDWPRQARVRSPPARSQGFGASSTRAGNCLPGPRRIVCVRKDTSLQVPCRHRRRPQLAEGLLELVLIGMPLSACALLSARPQASAVGSFCLLAQV